MTTYIICAFVSGFLLATVIFWTVTKQLQKDWQAEYRRLMGGIQKVTALLMMAGMEQNTVPLEALRSLYNGEDL